MADPWFKFFPTDWRQDPKLRICGLEARGLWIEMIALMHQATPYGHLLVSGQPPTDTQLAMLVGCTPDQITRLVGELETAGVFSRTRTGVIYSRKMSRMQKKAATARNNGKKGGNPSLGKERESPTLDNPKDKPQKPYSTVHIGEEGLDKSNPPPPTGGGGFDNEDLDRLFAAVGYDPDGHIPAAWRDGAAERFAAWVASGLSPDRIIAAAKDSRKHHPEPPASPKALNGVMDRALATPPKLTVVADQGAIDARNAQNIKDGKGFLVQSLSPGVIRGLIQKQLVTEEECQRAGVRI